MPTPDLPARRRRFVPGAVSAHDGDLWIADATRPLLVRLGGNGSADVVWDAPLTRSEGVEALHADKTGVWVVGRTGVRHIAPTLIERTVLDEDVGTTAVSGGVLAAAGPHRWPDSPVPDTVRLLRTGESPTAVRVPGRVSELVACDEGFLALVTDFGPSPTTPIGDRSRRLARIRRDGTVQSGPQLPAGPSLLDALVGGPTPLLASQATSGEPPTLRIVTPHLTLGRVVAPVDPLRMWTGADGRIVLLTHLPDGTGPTGWWPLAGPLERPRYTPVPNYLLCELDVQTAQSLRTVALAGAPTSVCAGRRDGRMTLWLSMWSAAEHKHLVCSWSVGDGAPVRLDLDALPDVQLHPPLPADDLRAWEQRQLAIARVELDAGRGELDPIDEDDTLGDDIDDDLMTGEFAHRAGGAGPGETVWLSRVEDPDGLIPD